MSTELSVDEIRQAVDRLQRELDNDEPIYGVTYDRDLATVLVTVKQWLADQQSPHLAGCRPDPKHEGYWICDPACPAIAIPAPKTQDESTQPRVEYGWRSLVTDKVYSLPKGPLPSWWHNSPRKRWDPMYRKIIEGKATDWMPLPEERHEVVVGVDWVNGLVLHEGDIDWHPWDELVYGTRPEPK